MRVGRLTTTARWQVSRWRVLVTAGVALGLALGGLSLADALRGPAGASSGRTVTYCVEGGQDLAMTVFTPGNGSDDDPAVVQVHGGGWQHGSRTLALDAGSTGADLVAAGFVVASVDYRLAPQNPWPEQIVDVKCAVRYLRANAAEFGVDPNRIAALGTSAGGQLVSLLGTTGSSPLWDAGPYADESSRVAAVVDEFGPADLNAAGWPPGSVAMIRQVFDAPPGSGSPVLTQASPQTHVAPGDPPFLIVQGTDDQVVPETQSEQFAAQLRAAGDAVQFVSVLGGRHGLETPGEDPSSSAISTMITAYLVRTLGG
jgi:acetyl esterase/lipase